MRRASQVKSTPSLLASRVTQTSSEASVKRLRKAGDGSLDVHQAPMMVKVPAAHGRHAPSVRKGEGLVQKIAIFGPGHQNGPCEADIPIADVFGRGPDIRKALEGGRFGARNRTAGGVVAGGVLSRVDKDFLALEAGVQIVGGGHVFFMQSGQIFGKAGVLQPQKGDLPLGDEIVVALPGNTLDDLGQKQKMRRAYTASVSGAKDGGVSRAKSISSRAVQPARAGSKSGWLR